MLTGGFYHKSGLKIYFIFVIDMKSIGGRFVHSIDGRSVRGIAAFVSVWLVLVAIRRDFMNMLSWGARDLEQIYKTGAEGEK